MEVGKINANMEACNCTGNYTKQRLQIQCDKHFQLSLVI